MLEPTSLYAFSAKRYIQIAEAKACRKIIHLSPWIAGLYETVVSSRLIA